MGGLYLYGPNVGGDPLGVWMRSVLAALLAAVLAVPAFAEDSPGPANADIRITDEISPYSLAAVQSAVDDAVKAKAKHLTVYLNTSGGSIYAGMRIIRAIRASKIPTTCIVEDIALSMGASILESNACGERVAQEYSIVMFHSARGGAAGNQVEIEDQLQVIKMLDKIGAKSIAKRLGISVDDYLKRTLSREWWITGEELVSQHVVDRLLPAEEPAK